RGKGNYLDDIELPGMLHMAILRSPHAHARVKSVDTAAAGAMPGVIAVVTGELMAQHKLAWMPTLTYDTQAGLATDQVRFQGQEGAAVVAATPPPREAAPPQVWFRPRGGSAGGEHPDHLARHRRRVRQQGAGLPWLRRRHRREPAHRASGEVGGGPDREPDLDRLRPRLPHDRRPGGG